ncbi:FAD/FMN-containing dehydrogenase [Rubrobacter radiotolerans]|uniref:FAD/FMN-containing dehydrogenase n=2 Tax=Rubrobacter radiotolerans TaxID=42256 RepID=A0A023X5U5_RUBRA|nr:FAD/FMN-containing dehydrogenase [Rubrobacter radiotolerans]SMC07136.1 glycolate oxidase [Rubrobacter radiotolerans DSM 5868]
MGGRSKGDLVEREKLIEAMEGILGESGVIHEREQLRTYECDGLMNYRVIPDLVVLPESVEEVQRVVRVCYDEGIPFVARGSGTGLSGGALPVESGILIVLTRMRRIIEVDLENMRMVVEPGVINLHVSNEVASEGYYYAPDPASQSVSTIGGNLAENSGGVHCLKYGFTTNHVMAAEVVLADGTVVNVGGGKANDAPGYELLGTFVGSEGTLGIVTKVTLKLMKRPESVRTLLAAFGDLEEAGEAVSGIIAAGIVPAAIEMMDAQTVEAVERTVKPGFPQAEAILIVELDGPSAEVESQFRRVEEICRESKATEIRIAESDEQRALFWKGRKAAFAAMGSVANDYYVQDSVVPRTALGTVLKRIGELSEEHGLTVANVFHAGDGNLHPLVLYNNENEGEGERAEALAGEIVFACLEHGGSLTGEHGIGLDKKKYMPKMFTDDDMDTMQLLRCAFDPHHLCNPGKVFPTPRLCGERPGPWKMHPIQKAGLAEMF